MLKYFTPVYDLQHIIKMFHPKITIVPALKLGKGSQKMHLQMHNHIRYTKLQELVKVSLLLAVANIVC